MIIRITEKEYPDIWNNIIDDPEDLCLRHRRGSNFYSNPVYKIDDHEFSLPNHPELHGFWQSEETLYWSDDWGFDSKPSTLVRVEEVAVSTYEWKRIEKYNEG